MGKKKMGWPASDKTLDTWVQEVDQAASAVKAGAEAMITASAAGNTTAENLRQMFNLLVQANNTFDAAAAVSGIAQYVKDIKGDQGIDPVAEFLAMQAAIVSTLNWLRANWPSGSFSGGDYVLAWSLPTDNKTPAEDLTFTAGQTAGLRTVLTALAATVD